MTWTLPVFSVLDLVVALLTDLIHASFHGPLLAPFTSQRWKNSSIRSQKNSFLWFGELKNDGGSVKEGWMEEGESGEVAENNTFWVFY